MRVVFSAVLTVFAFTAASAGPLSLNAPKTPTEAAPVRPVNAQRPSLGGGFLELLFGGLQNATPRYESNPFVMPWHDRHSPDEAADPARTAVHPRFFKQVVSYNGNERSGTIIINTNDRMLYLVQDNGSAIRYGIGVGRPGFTWAGVHHITQKREWPDWTPPPEMLKRRPDLPRYMEGGPENPLGARAMYLGSTLYRIHGSNEPWTIGTAVSSGCIRMRNEDVIDLYSRVRIGTKVVVI